MTEGSEVSRATPRVAEAGIAIVYNNVAILQTTAKISLHNQHGGTRSYKFPDTCTVKIAIDVNISEMFQRACSL